VGIHAGINVEMDSTFYNRKKLILITQWRPAKVSVHERFRLHTSNLYSRSTDVPFLLPSIHRFFFRFPSVSSGECRDAVWNCVPASCYKSVLSEGRQHSDLWRVQVTAACPMHVMEINVIYASHNSACS